MFGVECQSLISPGVYQHLPIGEQATTRVGRLGLIPDRVHQRCLDGLLRKFARKPRTAMMGLVVPPLAAQEPKKPNILVIWGNDVDWFNVSALNFGIMD
jgi:hypothetical protein